MFYMVDANNFKEQVLDASGLVLVNFWTRWSDECRKMSALMHKVNGFLDEQDTILRIDWKQQKQLAQELEVVGVPTLLIYIEGREVARYLGKMEKEELINRIIEAKHHFQGKEN